jgi:hypothetical protein
MPAAALAYSMPATNNCYLLENTQVGMAGKREPHARRVKISRISPLEELSRATISPPVAANPDVAVTVSGPAAWHPDRVWMRPNHPPATGPNPASMPFPAAWHPDVFRSRCRANDFHLRRGWRRSRNRRRFTRAGWSGLRHVHHTAFNAARKKQHPGGQRAAQHQS